MVNPKIEPFRFKIPRGHALRCRPFQNSVTLLTGKWAATAGILFSKSNNPASVSLMAQFTSGMLARKRLSHDFLVAFIIKGWLINFHGSTRERDSRCLTRSRHQPRNDVTRHQAVSTSRHRPRSDTEERTEPRVPSQYVARPRRMVLPRNYAGCHQLTRTAP